MGLRYSLEESLNQVRSRSDDIVRRKENRKAVLLTASAAVLSVLLFAALGYISGRTKPMIGESVYGSYMLSDSAGGYVLVAVIAFSLGVLLAVAVRNLRNRKSAASATGTGTVAGSPITEKHCCFNDYYGLK